jgi:hypothetical protein
MGCCLFLPSRSSFEIADGVDLPAARSEHEPCASSAAAGRLVGPRRARGSSSNTIPVDAFSAGADDLVVGFGSTFDRYDFGG